MLISEIFKDLFKSKTILFKKTNLIKKNISYFEFLNNVQKLSFNIDKNHGSFKNEIVFLKLSRSIDFYSYFFCFVLLGAKVVILDLNIDRENFYILRKRFKPKAVVDQNFLIKKIQNSKNKINILNKLKYSKIILFTSGTTGKPKAIVLNTIKFFESAIQFSKLIPIKKNDVILNNWPHYYTASVFNMFLCGFLNNCSIVLEDQISSSNYFNYWKIIKKNKITIAYLTPTMSIALINYKRFQNKISGIFKKLKIISTGAYLYPYLEKKFFDEFKINLLDCYGATEIGASVTLINESKKFKISKGVKFLIKNGKLGFSSNYMFEGYLVKKNKLEKNNKKIYFTGDVAKKYNDQFKIIGRENEIIKKGGSQVSLIKIENQIMENENVIDVICKPKKSKFWVEDFESFVIFKKYNNESIPKLIKFLSQKLTSIEMPDKIFKVSEIKKTSIGKKIRQKLKF